MENLGVTMKHAFWKNKQVLITGHEGFLGSNLTKELLSSGAVITGLDIYTNRPQTLFTKDEYKRVKTYTGSVADAALIETIIKKHSPDVVFHLAAEALVHKCNEDPILAYKSNIEGTCNILESCRKHGKQVQAIIVASSDKAYGSHKVLPYREDAPLIGNHPYDVSKSCADLITYTYFNTYQLPVAVTRCGNIYGPGDFNFSRIIPDAVRCSMKGETLNIRSDGKFTRDYVFVKDIVNGYIMLAEQLKSKKLAGHAFNFSDENPINVIQLTKKIFTLCNTKTKCKILNTAQYEIKHQYLASNKARKVLGWKPNHTLEQGLSQAIEWYKQVL
jgi:CDP-glucose 4,6-dehydratase